MEKKTIFITGTTGKMGGAGLKELLRRREKFQIVILVRPSKKNKRLMSKFLNEQGLKIIWGDITNYDDVLKCVTGAHYVLHTAALIPPMAQHNHEAASKTNIGSTINIINAIKAQPNSDSIKLVYIGSVAMTGDRLPPYHVGRVGDPLKPSIYDFYATTKIASEKIVIESGLKYWVSCRQTYIAIPDVLSLVDSIMFHQPLNTHIEFCTVNDAGRLLANVCEDNVPEEFWRNIYNIGGGPGCRITYFQYCSDLLHLFGLGHHNEILERNWFALKNFHCHWFEDSHILNDYLHFQKETLEHHFKQVKASRPWYTRLMQKLWINPSKFRWIIKKLIFEPKVKHREGILYWIRKNLHEKVTAYFGSKELSEKIPLWGVDMPQNVQEYFRLDHGYDESKPRSQLDINDMCTAAHFRGGQCLSEGMMKGDVQTKLLWKCASNHAFEASPTLILLAGHWCPDCTPPPWNYDEEAKKKSLFCSGLASYKQLNNLSA